MKKFFKNFLEVLPILVIFALFMSISAGNLYIGDFGHDVRTCVHYALCLIPALYALYAYGKRKGRDENK